MSESLEVPGTLAGERVDRAVALLTGWSRAEVIVPRLDGWLTEEYRSKESWWADSLTTLALDLCAEKLAGDLRRLNGYLKRRTAAHPSEQSKLAQALERSAPGGCPTP